MAVAGPDALDARIADAFPVRQQFATAAGLALRVARALLGAMTPADFEGAETRVIRHRAGFADLEQSGSDFPFLFGLPNFFFYLTMGCAALRAAGVPLGKADFDGLHAYPADVRF